MISRRDFLKVAAAAGGTVVVAGVVYKLGWPSWGKTVPFKSDKLKKFVQKLRGLGDIPVAQPDKIDPGWWQKGVTHYTLDVAQYEDQLHPDLPNPTRLWGFGQNGKFAHLGGIIAAKRGEPVQVTFRNKLPQSHILPVDPTIMGADEPENRIDIHLHGGLVPWISDGGPHAWWDPNGKQGPSFLNNKILRPGQTVPANEAEYYYPNDQGARLLWYHDHALGITRLNAYAGIASAYVITDDYEADLVAKHNLPGPLDPRTVYLVFQEKKFVSETMDVDDAGWRTILPNSRAGDLWYAHVYDTAKYGDLGEAPEGPPSEVSCVPEFFGDTMLVNGTAYPTVDLEPRQYRLRLLNACQARFLTLRLFNAQGSNFPASTEPNLKAAGPGFIQIGTEGGFLPNPAMVSGPNQSPMIIAPGERADALVDLRDIQPGTTLILFNDAPGPFPDGDDHNDFYPENSNTPASKPGHGPDTRTLLQIRVKQRSGTADAPISLPAALTPTDPFLVQQTPGAPTPIPSGIPVRYLTLNEDVDEHGRLIQYLGTDQAVDPSATTLAFGRKYSDEPTEVIHAGSTEVWEIINLSADTHPIHFHLSNVQVLSRQKFAVEQYSGGVPGYQGGSFAPDLNELGWKETVRMNPGEVTRVLMKFDLPKVPFTVPVSPRTGGNEYVWHCHILEHEEHDMMRPLVVI